MSPNTSSLRDQDTNINPTTQFLGGTIGLAVGESVFSSQLTKNLLKYAPTAPAAVIKQSPVMIRTSVPAELIPAVITAYIKSLDIVYVVGAPLAALGMFAAFFIKNVSLKAPQAAAGKKGEEDTEKQAAVTPAVMEPEA